MPAIVVTKSAVIIAAGLMLATPARAADMWVSRYADGSYLIRINGKILAGDEQKFAVFAETIPKKAETEVLLTSRGGSILGLEIGRIVHRRGFKTVALQSCSSMCSLIWLASPKRALYKGTFIGFHAVGDHCAEEGGCQNISAPGNALLGAFLNELEFSEQVIRFVTSAPPTGVTWLSAENAGQYSINYEILGYSGAPEVK
jgi:hypothetical protein